jgi:hypothetical protein
MEEKTDSGGIRFFAEHLRKQHQMIVMNPDEVIRPDNLKETFAENFIYLFVPLPVIFIIGGKGWKIMKEGPDSFIAEAVVEEVHLFIGKKDRNIFEFRFKMSRQVFAVIFFHRHAGPSDPVVLNFLLGRGSIQVEIGTDSRNQTSGALLEIKFSAAAINSNRQAIGNDNKPHIISNATGLECQSAPRNKSLESDSAEAELAHLAPYNIPPETAIPGEEDGGLLSVYNHFAHRASKNRSKIPEK